MLIGTDLLDSSNGDVLYSQRIVRLSGMKYPFTQANGEAPGVAEVVTDSELYALLGRYQKLFFKEGDQLTEAVGIPPMGIVTEGGGGPIFQRPYRAALTKQAAIEECVVQMLDDGVISPSQSPWASPVTIVTRKDGKTKILL